MGNKFELEGYSFIKVKEKNNDRPFRVKFIETGEEKDSSISHISAASLLLEQYNFSQAIIDSNNKDESYIKKVFNEVLLGRKKSECDYLVKSQIVEKERIKGKLISIQSRERAAKNKEYLTEYFKINVMFENGLTRGATNIFIEKRIKNV